MSLHHWSYVSEFTVGVKSNVALVYGLDFRIRQLNLGDRNRDHGFGIREARAAGRVKHE